MLSASPSTQTLDILTLVSIGLAAGTMVLGVVSWCIFAVVKRNHTSISAGKPLSEVVLALAKHREASHRTPR